MMFKRDDKPTCPLIRAACIEARCMWWTHVRGTHPQTGLEVDMHDCSVRWLPVLLIDNAKETRQAAAAIESSRNESVRCLGLLARSVLAAPVKGELLEVKQDG